MFDVRTGERLEGALIVLIGFTGVHVDSTLTGASGTFAFRIRPGRYTVAATRPSYADTTSHVIGVSPEATARVVIGMRQQPFQLDPIDAVVSAGQEKLERVGFYRRQDIGFGYFFGHEEISRVVGGRILELLRGLPGIRVVQVNDGTGDFDVVMRGGTCHPTIAVDWNIVRRGSDAAGASMEALPHPASIEAVEVYPSPAGVPARLRSEIGTCGVIVFWTK